jgi:hypothetical protein
MGFDPKEVDELLAKTGRHCCICGTLHQVQVHHIKPKDKGGSNAISNAIPLCPNCHDEVHKDYVPGRTTRIYTTNELKKHLKRTIDRVRKEGKWSPGSMQWKEDKVRVQFFAQCLDRDAFRAHFHEERSYVDFDDAMEDTIIALNTGYWRMRDGTLIQRAEGKSHVIHPAWRAKLDQIADILLNVRRRFQNELGLDQMLIYLRHARPSDFHDRLKPHFSRFRHNRGLADWMDHERQKAIDLMNEMLDELGIPPLKGIRDH